MNFSIEETGNAFYILTLLVAALFLIGGHQRGRINLWELFTATDRNGIARTDGRKVFEAVMFFVMTVTFYFLSVTGKLSEWYVLIYGALAVGARFGRDYAKIKGQAPSSNRA